MSKLKSTVGFVGENGVVLKDHSVFDKGDVVVLISAENINELLGELMKIKENIDMSKRWVDEIKEIE
ncbi:MULTISPECIES: hypothetical protein [Methanobacterium]|jgi:hypothetical protein|uniref:Uncharacterized protein n=1 Tax=Methanobacterium veterum TaxID=408577 RepID=A0A9E5DIZ7_9EURY|nr:MULTISPECIES: hypothetical protein [Methanobacterium]MCZ3367391.1 hypothetical protein [Methanobacterium veterum]MCZ3373461.1 hypothetical protein [Methanobacterium veterum]